MSSIYLQPADYTVYGVSTADTNLVTQASTLIDAYLKRPEGCIWSPGGDGQPCFMAGKTAQFTLAATGAIAPGTSVVVPVSGNWAGVYVGAVLVVDAANANVSEACVVDAVGNGSVTLHSVAFNHNSGASLEFGRVISEQKIMPQGRPLTILSKWPVVRLIAGQGRYGYGRRGGQNEYNVNDFNLLAAVSHFGGPPAWEQITVSAAGVDPITGQLWAPAGIMLAYHSETRWHYVGGWASADLPPQIKQACAYLVNALKNYPQLMGGNVQMLSAGDVKIQRKATEMFDADVKTLLDPYMARLAA